MRASTVVALHFITLKVFILAIGTFIIGYFLFKHTDSLVWRTFRRVLLPTLVIAIWYLLLSDEYVLCGLDSFIAIYKFFTYKSFYLNLFKLRLMMFTCILRIELLPTVWPHDMLPLTCELLVYLVLVVLYHTALMVRYERRGSQTKADMHTKVAMIFFILLLALLKFTFWH